MKYRGLFFVYVLLQILFMCSCTKDETYYSINDIQFRLVIPKGEDEQGCIILKELNSLDESDSLIGLAIRFKKEFYGTKPFNIGALEPGVKGTLDSITHFSVLKITENKNINITSSFREIPSLLDISYDSTQKGRYINKNICRGEERFIDINDLMKSINDHDINSLDYRSRGTNLDHEVIFWIKNDSLLTKNTRINVCATLKKQDNNDSVLFSREWK